MENPQKRFVLGLLAYAAQKDADPERLCKLSSIDWQALTGKSDEPLTPRQFRDLWLNAVHLTHDPLFGLHFGESLQLAALGSVGQLVQSCATVGEALTHASGAIHLITDLFRMEVSQSGPSFTIHYIPNQDHEKDQAFVLRQMMELFMVFTLHEADGLVLKKIIPKTVCIPYDLSKPEEYERVLRGKPVKKPGVYSMEFESRYWDEPILTANYELQTLLLKKSVSRTGNLRTRKP
ncbi:AraC family transcriptional regulator ligand-binding domain-containing protein [Larkinella arboricola]